LLYLFAGTWLFHRQVLREEEFMRGQYGEAYAAYRRRVRRYV
jgi:protein-S-isoprenylcysteine O-methyltransferase Ste14